MGLAVFVQDGFTITDDIPGVPGLYPTVRITYRPCTDDDVQEYNATPSTKAKAARAAVVLGHLQNQTISIVGVDAAGKETLEPVSLTLDAVGKLHSSLGASIVGRILGYVGPAVVTEKN
jgi:hypothetical protein